jgi:galactose oxidase
MFRPTSFLILSLAIFTKWTCLVTAAAVTELAPYPIDRHGWVYTTDSSDSSSSISNAFDDNTGTIWQTQYTGTVAPLPHFVSIDMNNRYLVNGFSYTPRQDGSTNGNIGTHTIETSLDGNSWTTAATGTWINDQTVKTTLFTPVIARYVRLTATTEASNTNQQASSAAELYVMTNPHATIARAGWTVSASSSQLSPQSFAASYAIDGSPNTCWKSLYINGNQPFPHYFKIDQNAITSVGGLSYLPPLDALGPNGRIGKYTIQYSLDDITWTTVTSGTWPDTQYIKFAEWTPIIARYWRLIAQSEAGNRGPWTNVAELNLLDGANQLANFVITVDSQETNASNNSAVFALDGDPTTFWHSQYNPATPLPHYYTIDMKTLLPVKALQYIPRQDGNANGNIGDHVIDVSTDGNTWTTVASGQFPDNAVVKNVIFQETVCRYVRLTAKSEAGNRGPWSSAAEFTISYDATYVPPAAQTVGQWGLTIDFPLVPVAIGAITSTGALVAWSSWNPDGSGFGGGSGQTLTAVYHPSTNEVSKIMVTNTDHDMFCPGISIDFNGRILVTGGNDAPRASLYQPTDFNWIDAPNMNTARGYQASATLSNGNIFTIGGSWSGGIFNKNGEYYNPNTNTWTALSGANVSPMLTNDAQGLYRADNHAWLFGWKNGAVFQAGPSKAMNWYTTSGNGGVTGAGTRSDTDAMCGNAVMYDAVAGKILTMGGAPSYNGVAAISTANIITINSVGAQAQVQKINDMHYKRTFANAVVMPTGKIFVVGGQDYGNPFSDDASIMYPELWDSNTLQWTVMAPMQVGRNYHSVAILLTDGTIMVGGGGLCDDCEMNHYDGQIYKPPYLFTSTGALAPRPTVISLSVYTIAIGGSITLVTDSPVTSFEIIRMSSATHTVNTDQRRIVLTPTSNGVNSYLVTIPNDAGIALPGYWMMFGINSAGVPSLARKFRISLS